MQATRPPRDRSARLWSLIDDLPQRFVIVAGVLAFVLLGYAAFVGVRSNLDEADESRWVSRTYRIITNLERARAHLGELTVLRRLSDLQRDGDEPRRVEQLELDIRTDIGEARVLVADPTARRALTELETVLDEALVTLDLSLARPLPRAQADAAITRVQTSLDRLLDIERDLLTTRAARQEAASRQARVVILIGSGLSMLLIFASGLLLYRQLRERQRALSAQRESEARTRALIHAIPDILMRVSAEGDILTFKPPADQPDPEWVRAMEGRRLPDVLPPDVSAVMGEGVRESLRSGGPRRAEFTMPMALVRPDDAQILDFEARFVPVGEREVLIISRDITDRKRVDRLKNEFVSTVSHELRTPLTSIRGSLSLIASGVFGTLQPRGARLVEIALSNSERLVRLINDILDIERIESGKLEFRLEPLDLGEVVTRAVEDNRGFAQPLGVELERTGRTTGPRVRADADRLLQALTNLISNAVKFSPRGAAVTVCVDVTDALARVSVRDRGPGIPTEFRARIFQRFAQADSADTREKGGTGLGLSITKAIADRHGGRVGFQDHPEGGTVFFLDLPVLEDLPVPSATARARRRLLICEDDPDIAHLLQLILERADLDADVAASAEDAERLLAERVYHALVLDLLLPGKDGITFIRELRRRPDTATLPIVVLSAVADQNRGVLNGDAVSVVDWINKPIDTGRLLDAVRRATPRQGTVVRVLHVDDDTDLQEVVRELLRGVATSEAVETIALARDHLRRERYDLVLLDLDLPDGSGLDLLPLLHEAHPPVPVLVFSASELDQGSAERVAATLVKSRTSNDELLETIRALVDPTRPPGGHDAP